MRRGAALVLFAVVIVAIAVKDSASLYPPRHDVAAATNLFRLTPYLRTSWVFVIVARCSG
jgi:hypothetical protein